MKDGDIVKAEIISMDAEERRIALSLAPRVRARRDGGSAEVHGARPWRSRAVVARWARAAAPGATLGDVLKQKLGDKIDDLAKE